MEGETSEKQYTASVTKSSPNAIDATERHPRSRKYIVQNRKLSRPSHLFEQVHQLLWDKILNAEILPGQRLKDAPIAKELAISRTPVREAMRKMQQEGILLSLNQGGYEVRSVDAADLQSVYRCRVALEVLAVREVARSFSIRVKKELEALIQRADDAVEREDLDRLFELNSEFHRTLIERTNNSHLIALLESLRKLITFYRSALLNRAKSKEQDKTAYLARLKKSQEGHRAILAALASQDVDRAARAMEQHLLAAARNIEKSISVGTKDSRQRETN